MGLIRYLVIAGVALLVYLLFRRLVLQPMRERTHEKEDERLGRLVQDPQCEVYVDNREAVRRKVPGGELFFCSETCANKYLDAHKGS